MNRTTRDRIRRYLEAFDFAGLFTDPDLGWDWPESKGKLRVPTKSGFIDTEVIANKRGVKVLHLAGLADGEIPASDERKAIEKAVTPLATEHLLIFTDKAKTRQVWLWTSRLPGKPISYRELTWEKGKSNELLLQKLASIAFTISEEESLDITGVVERLRDSLDRDKVTKRFYDQFKTQKDEFRKFIKGISDGGLWDWYTSLMLNRLMFCYFLQRKGFLDGDLNYLSNRLDRVRDEFGKGKFHSFYKTFLRRLFHEGLGAPKNERADDLKYLIGDVPYLNGGIFEEHKIERDHPGLHIPDEAFEKIFSFLDQFDWHLDDRPIAKGNEINPEILGYVFEKYTNQKEMGAYYTKEDITDYIAKNCIIPFLLDMAGDKLGGASWNLLTEDPDRYIYPAVGHGIFCDYPTNTKLDASLSLPDYIEHGIDTSKPDLRKRRARWNEPANPDLGLPTEIWRETITRRHQCEELQRKLRAGEIHSVNDLITLNLNIRQFAQDVVENASADLLLALFKHIRKVSVLDPTCGSGAFLFAALNILEPLYRASLDRMRALLGDWEARGDKSHPNYRKEFTAVLDQAARHPNENYFIFKSVIVHNLYGVDIMEEAVEICKLRLFLKLAAQLEPGQEIEPLPDIDFNIRAGNTLVGYANRDEVHRCMTQFGDGQMRLGVEDELQSYALFEEQVDIVDRQFRRFQEMQDDFKMDAAEFRKDKKELSRRLEKLRNQLDRFLAADYAKRNTANEAAFIAWRKSHRPFHWFVEFYGILNSGGFAAIIGNPPYVVYVPEKLGYSVQPQKYTTFEAKNLYALVTERCCNLSAKNGPVGLIVQLTAISSERMASLQALLLQRGLLIAPSFPRRPESMFDGVEMPVAIFISRPAPEPAFYSTRISRFYTEERPTALSTLRLTAHSEHLDKHRLAKLSSKLERVLVQKTLAPKHKLDEMTERQSSHSVYYQEACRYWAKALKGLPRFRRNGVKMKPPHGRILYFDKGDSATLCAALLNSSLFYWFYSAFSDCEHINDSLIRGFRVPATWKQSDWKQVGQRLVTSLTSNATRKKILTKQGHTIEYDELNAARSKKVIDEIDTVLAKHYGFTEEELDFIINYDIKYRMGTSGNSGEDSGE